MTVFASNRMTLDEYRRLYETAYENAPARSSLGLANGPPGGRGAGSRAPSPACGKSEMKPASCGHKYRAESCAGPDGQGGTIRYQSKKGARLARQLEEERLAGGIVAFSPEPSLIIGSLGGKPIRHRPDALAILTVEPDGSFHGRFVEAKGYDVREGRRKRLATERALGVRIQVL